MIIYQLKRCEEYWMQEDHGLFATREAAVKAVGQALLIYPEPRTSSLDGEVIILVTNDEDDPRTSVVARGGLEVTCDTLKNYLHEYEFYDIIHNGYQMWGVFATPVQE